MMFRIDACTPTRRGTFRAMTAYCRGGPAVIMACGEERYARIRSASFSLQYKTSSMWHCRTRGKRKRTAEKEKMKKVIGLKKV